MKAFEIRGRHLLGRELDEVGAVGAGAPAGRASLQARSAASSAAGR